MLWQAFFEKFFDGGTALKCARVAVCPNERELSHRRSERWCSRLARPFPLPISARHNPETSVARRVTEKRQYDTDQRARSRMCDQPRVKLQERDEHHHGDDCKTLAAKNEEPKNSRNGSEYNAECNSHRRNQRCVLEVLLCSKIIGRTLLLPGL